MSGPPPKPPGTRARRHKPGAPGATKNDWKAAPGVGWQHGPIPAPPDDLKPSSVETWRVWFESWWASNWTPADLPMLRKIIATFDTATTAEDLRRDVFPLAKAYGITPEGRQTLRWSPPATAEPGPKPKPASTKDQLAERRERLAKRRTSTG